MVRRAAGLGRFPGLRRAVPAQGVAAAPDPVRRRPGALRHRLERRGGGRRGGGTCPAADARPVPARRHPTVTPHPAEHATTAASVNGWLVLLGAVGASGYLIGLFQPRRRNRRWPATRTACALAGCGAVASAAVVPSHPFTGHVAGHLLLTMLAPLLLALSAPVLLALRTLPPAPRRAVTAVLRSRTVRTVTRPAVLAPLVVILQVGGLFAFYLTPLFALAHQHPMLGALVHLHMFLAGYLFSWYLVGRDPRPHRPSTVLALGVLVIVAVSHDVLAKLLYARQLPTTAGDPDQIRAGAQLLYYGGTAIETVIAVLVMADWYRRGARRRPRGQDLPEATVVVRAGSRAAPDTSPAITMSTSTARRPLSRPKCSPRKPMSGGPTRNAR
ncbi:cytochrome c oxidase assembly protein [Nakamurella flava]|uniref:Cytochrome c oxidase assembly protein n=1 Tax=Nakamurella flava TaxID=2576308 RepID=A0A4U6QN72_9ACTN|nr:cytochrome c oxidase assembly protein [Nakamurella flava]